MKFKEALLKSIKSLSSNQSLKKSTKHLPILQEITSLGFLIVEHQFGKYKEPSKIHDRAYIIGFMLENQAEKFINYMSLYTDKVAICAPVVKDVNVYDIPVTVDYTNKINITDYIATEVSVEVYKEYCTTMDVSVKEPMILVVCWDPMWNRNATSSTGLFYNIHTVLRHIAKN